MWLATTDISIRSVVRQDMEKAGLIQNFQICAVQYTLRWWVVIMKTRLLAFIMNVCLLLYTAT